MGTENLVKKATQKYANALVGGYNWVTGGNKYDLSNALLYAAPVFETSGAAVDQPFFVIPALPATTIISWAGIQENRRYERMAKSAKEGGAMLWGEDFYKTRRMTWGYIHLGFAAFMGVGSVKVPSFRDKLCLGFFATGLTLRAHADLVALADDFPRRKNCVRRGADKLSELVARLRPKPAPAML